MNEFKIIKKNNKFYLVGDFLGEMMIYGVNSDKPYVKKFGGKVYLTAEYCVELKSMM